MVDFKENSGAVLLAGSCGDAADMAPNATGLSVSLRHLTILLPDGRALFSDLNETFHAERVGLVGRNGAGKSVLARTMVGLVTPDTGRVVRRGTILYVPQTIVPAAQSTVAQLAGLGPVFDALARVEAGDVGEGLLDLLEGQWDAPVKLQQALDDSGLAHLRPRHLAAALSGGELTRVALIGAFLSGADGLVLDEPTNHLDRAARLWLHARLAQWQGGAVVISHDRELLDGMDRMVELNATGLHSYGGNYTLYRTQRDAQAVAAQMALQHARAERNTALRALRRQHDAVQQRAARNNKAAKQANLPGIYKSRLKDGAQAYCGREQMRQQASKSALQDAVRQAAERTEDAPALALMLPATAVAPGKRVVTLQDAVPPFPVDTPPLSLTLAGPARLAIKGPNGSGKTSLLKMLAGRLAPVSGACQVGVECAWLDQHSSRLLPAGLSVLERLGELRTPLPEGQLRSHLSCLGLGAAQVHRKSGALSGGERLKAALACALWGERAAQLLLLDEPTNHLDLDSIAALEQALSGYPGALIVVSHDERFLDALDLTHTLEHTSQGWRLESV